MYRSFAFLCAVAVACCLAACAGPRPKYVVQPDNSRVLDGAWRLVAFKAGGEGKLQDVSKDQTHMKYVTGGRFVWTNVKDGKIASGASGSCWVHGDRYTECVQEVVLPGDAWLRGKPVTFSWKLKDGKWHHKGVIEDRSRKEKIYQVWERVK